MNNVLKTFSVISFAFFSTISNAEPVQQLNESEFLSIHEYETISSSFDGGKLTKTIVVVASNNTSAPLYHVYLYLDGMPSNVTREGWAYFPEMRPGELQESNTAIEYTIDLNRQESFELELIWQIKTEINGEQVIDEIAVVESIQ